MKLYDYQLDAIHKMKNGCILCGGVGSGKSLTALSYYYLEQGGSESYITGGAFKPMVNDRVQDLYIITTARKRDTKEWEGELIPFLSPHDKFKVVIDSWNNIGKYTDVTGAFFIFDEQRVVGSGAWVKSFLKIARDNNWILLSATPGDCWQDYIPVFLANGFYRNITEFKREHIVYSRFCTKFPKIDRYINTGRLIRLRNSILVDMDYNRTATRHEITIDVPYDVTSYKYVMKNRWDIYNDEPIVDAAGLCRVLRKIVNTDDSRVVHILSLIEKQPKVIIFYNYDYELEILINMAESNALTYAQWNGHKHQEIPDSDHWVYLVQYTAGAEGWNCIQTDTIIFYSQNYSYKIMEQAMGRIDRLNTPYTDLYYYHLKSKSSIDLAINKALIAKKKFNEGKFANCF